MGNYFIKQLRTMAGGFADSYYYFLKYTMKEGIISGIYQFLLGMEILSADTDTEEKVDFISGWVFESWGNDAYYYKMSKTIWTFLLDEDEGICYDNDDTMCEVLYYYWMLIMTLNIFITLPLSHAAAVYEWYTGWEEKIEGLIDLFE